MTRGRAEAAPETRARHDQDAYAFPLSFAQTRLWVIDQLAPGSTLYNLKFAVRLQQAVDAGILQRAIAAVVERHEVLRTVFRVVDGEPAQIVLPSMAVPLECFDLRSLPPERREAEVVRLGAELGERPFDLSRGPLLRTMLIWLGPNDYALVLSVHHVVADGWSMGVLAEELGLVYERLRLGGGLGLAGLPVQYADFAVWQRGWLSGERLQSQLGYWRGVLGGLPVLGLPLDRARPAVQAHRGAGLGFVLPSGLVGRLSGLARECGATLFMVLLAAYGLVLGRWARQGEVVVGAPIAGRNRAELEGLIGFFVNTLVLRLDLGGDPSFAGLVGRVREVALGAYAHADVPFEKLVEELAPGRDLSRNPLFQVTFQLFESPRQPDALPAGAGLELPVTSSLFDLRLDLSPAGEGGLAGRVEYDLDLFERCSIEWLIERYRFALEQLVAQPERPVSELSLLPPGQARLVADWNDTAHPIPAGCVHEQVEAQARTRPEALALTDAHGQWTYAQLNQQANRLAARLLALEAGAGELVALCLPRSRAFAASALATLKTGAAYLPLDHSYPPARIEHILADAKPRVLITTPELAPTLPLPTGCQLLTLPPSPWPDEHTDPGDPGLPVQAEAAAYVIYTSGSTGTPKGVVVEHHSLLNLIAWHQHTYQPSQQTRAAQIASVGFDAAVWELWPYLTAGASVHICDDDTRNDPHHLLTWLTNTRITIAFIPTPLAETLLTQPWPPQAQLTHLLTGGDTLRHYANPHHPYTLVNHYGPTEATVVTTHTTIPSQPQPGQLPSIGHPIHNTSCHVLDPHGHELGPGCPGELHIAGHNLARGYHHDPHHTHQRFHPHPHHHRLYQTGDLVRWHHDGTLTFLGRTDTQIKIRGHRIEPNEIETQLTHHPHIHHALITTTPTHNGTPQLTAYITTTDGAPPNRSALRRWLRGRLPDALVPTAVVALDEFPITAHGKIDRDALPLPGPDDRELRSSAAPANPSEEALCRLWADALGVEHVGVDDDFFDLGGHSLLATQLVSRIRDAFRFDLPLRTLFERPTPGEIAAVLRSEAGPPEQADRAAAVLLKVMALSEEDVATLLGDLEDADARAAS